MKKPTFSNAQIIEAGKRLQAENKLVTPFGIRNLLGGGNHIRIKAVWDEAVQAGLDQLPTLVSEPSLPVLSLPVSLESRHIASLRSVAQVSSVTKPLLAPLECIQQEKPVVVDPMMEQLREMDRIVKLFADLSVKLETARKQLNTAFPLESLYLPIRDI